MHSADGLGALKLAAKSTVYAVTSALNVSATAEIGDFGSTLRIRRPFRM